jgi:hypothetical protein
MGMCSLLVYTMDRRECLSKSFFNYFCRVFWFLIRNFRGLIWIIGSLEPF